MSIVNHIVDDTVVFGGFSSKQDYCRLVFYLYEITHDIPNDRYIRNHSES